MGIGEFVGRLTQFDQRSKTEQVKILAWYLHIGRAQERFSARDMNKCFDDAHVARPSNTGVFLKNLVGTKQMLVDKNGYRLSASARAQMKVLLPRQTNGAQTTAILRDLEARVADPAQRLFLGETVVCFNNGAYRSAIVMAWNLAYSHVCDSIFAAHLPQFIAELKSVAGSKATIVQRTDFEDYKESKVLQAARACGAIGPASYKTLTEKLNKRNQAAHPSSTIMRAVTAEEVIQSLVENIILRAVL